MGDGDDGKTGASKATAMKPEESNTGSVLLGISGVLLGVCLIGAIVIFGIRRWNSAKYSEANSGSTMGHVYGYGGNAPKSDSYRDGDDDDDEEEPISLKF